MRRIRLMLSVNREAGVCCARSDLPQETAWASLDSALRQRVLD